MPEEYITRVEHQEFAKRLEEENARQNHRLAKLEEAVTNINNLTVSVSKLAVSMEAMADEQKKTNERLTALEQEPGQNWSKFFWIVLTALVGAAVGYFIR